jgi:1-acyl-sn-glycerol-3-phosphate acyltransferase
MKKIFIFLYQFYKWLFLLPFFLINSVFFGIIAVILSLFVNQKIGSFVGGVVWANLNCILTPAFIKIKGREHIRKHQSYVIIANHQSAYDILVLYARLGIDFKWVMKKEIRKIPGIGFGSMAVGHIFIDRSSTKAALASINAAKSKIKNGTSVVFFPEGTRSRVHEMLPFKKGAFRFAFDLNLPILPVTINGTKAILPSGSTRLLPGKVEILIHPPIDIRNYSEQNIQDLMNIARKSIGEGLKPYIDI